MALWADSRIQLGLSESEFYDLAMVELEALFASHHRREAYIDYRFGKLCEVIARVQGVKDVKPEDFFPSIKSLTKESAPEQSADQMLAWAQMFASLNTTKNTPDK